MSNVGARSVPVRCPVALLALGLLIAGGPGWLGAVEAAPTVPAAGARTAPFILGADISWVPTDEPQGAEYFDHGVKKDIFQILPDYKFNYVRLGVIVETSTTNHAAGLTLDELKAAAKRVKAAGMGLLVDFMYGDTWTSSEGQSKPATWKALPFPELVRALHDHTRTVLAALKEQGTTPDMVQIGNEITFGLLWPDGRVTSKISSGNPDTHNANVTDAGGWENLATLLKAGVAAVREVDPNIKIMLHHSLARNDALVHEWLEKLTALGVPFDLVGLSCYVQHQDGDWQKTFDDITANYPKLGFIAVEYSGNKRLVNDLVFNTRGGHGLGTFIWEPTRSQETVFDRPPVPGAAPAAGTATLAAAVSRRSPGGRYDTNGLIKLYADMAAAYGNDRSVAPRK